jgi:hypothetical protein
MEIAMNGFRNASTDSLQVAKMLQSLGISDAIIKSANKQVKAERAGTPREKKRAEPER